MKAASHKGAAATLGNTGHARSIRSESSDAPSLVRLSVGDVVLELGWAGGPVGSVPAMVTEERGAYGAGWAAAEPTVEAAAVTGTVTAPAAPGNGSPAAAGAATFPLRAHTVGAFYRAPEPGAPPFVTEGDVVTPGQQVATAELETLLA